MKLYYLLFAFSFAIAFACNSDPENKDTNLDPSYPLEKVAEITGIEWHCTKFIDIENNTFVDIKSKAETSFLFQMHSDGTFQGKTSSNSISGKYKIAEDEEKILLFDISTTEVMENEEGEYFVTSLSKTKSYHFAKDKSVLNLYFNNNKNSLYFIKFDIYKSDGR